ncbi:MAG: FAD-linked oxidase C-terminal domain-containing protein [Verrucomicrobiota bacterium]
MAPPLASLESQLPADRFRRSQADREAFGRDKWHAEALPEAVVCPESTLELAATLRWANQHRQPVYPRGAGVGYVGGCVPLAGGIVLSTHRMNQILEMNPGDGVAVVQPGVLTHDLQEAARERGWYYPPDPASLKESSIGGNIATNAGGPRCLKYGVTRHYVLGLEVVRADGTLVRTGSRCHKNKTGFDLTGLFVGSEGLLGVITEATLRLLPHPPSRAMVSAVFPDFATAASAVNALLDSGRLPSALEIADGFTLNAARHYLGPGKLPEGDAHLIVEIDGQTESVALEVESLRRQVERLGGRGVQVAPHEEACEAIWQLRRDFSYALRATGLVKLNEDIVVPRSRLVDLVNFARQMEAETGIPIACFGHAGDGNIHTNLMVKDYHQDARAREKADAALDTLFRQILAWKGCITGEHGVGLAKKPWFREAVGEAGFRAHLDLKKTWDPHRILNPGKFLG